MNIYDIIILIPFVWAIYRGFGQGVVLQLGGIVGVLIGAWLAYHFGGDLGSFFGISDPLLAKITGFLIIFVLFVLAISLITHILKGVVKLAGLGMLDTIGGVLLSAVKMAIIVSVLIVGIEGLDKKRDFISQQKVDGSLFYKPLRGLSGHIFPYIDLAKDKLLGSEPEQE